MRVFRRSNIGGYIVAVGATAAAVVVRIFLTPWLGQDAPIMLLILSLLASSWYGGLGPGLAATILSLGAGTFFFLEPINVFQVADNSDRLRLLLFALIGVAISFANEIRLSALFQADERQRQLEQEIRDRERAESAEREQRERLHVTLASIGDAVITTDADAKVDFLNSVAETLTGWTRDEAAGQSLETVFRIVDETTGEPDENPAVRVLREGSTGRLASHSLLRAKNGTEFPIDDSAAPIRDGQGQIIGCVLVFRDVTEQRRVEARIKAEQQRVQMVADAVPALISYVDTEARYRLNNRTYERWFGHPRSQATGRKMQDVLGDEAWEIIRPHVEAALAGQVVNYECEVPFRDGETRWINATYTPDVDPKGHVRGFVAHVNDVTDRKRAEEALRESEERFRLFMDNSPATAFVKDSEGHYLYVNRLIERQSGRSGDQWIGKTDRDMFPPEQADQFRRNDLKVLSSREVGQFLESVPYAEGIQHFMSFKFPLQEMDGTWLVAGMSIDVTEQKRAEEAHRESEERFRLIVESARDFAIFTMDREGNITSWNSGAKNIFGYDESEVRGQSGRLVFVSEDRERGAPELEIEKALREGRAENERWHVRKDGSRFWGSGLMMPLRDGQQLVGFLKILRDTTEARIAEERLQESEERFRTLAESIPQLAWTARPDGNVYWYNKRWYEYTGTTPEEMEANGWQSVLDPEVVPGIVERWNTMLAIGERFDMDWPVRGGDGQHRPFLTLVVPLKDRAGRIVQWFGTSTDISERRAMEEALLEADRRKDEFLATLAHELRNPLAPIRTGLELMRLTQDDPATLEEIRITMERQTQQLITLVDDLLDISRITRGKLELRRCRVELGEVVESAVEASRPFIDEAGHELTVSIPEAPIIMNADPHRLAQVLTNLLGNAAKYTPDGGRIGLSARRENGSVAISVRDNGIGIPANMLERIFELFAQIDRPMEKGYTGLGIGLTLVKSLVEMHGGRIEVHSEGPNQGSEFTVHLPILDAESPETRSAPPNAVSAKVKRRVLVVDDNKAAADMLSLVIKMLGNEIRTACDGHEAVEAAQEFQPDLILMDLGMPRMNGFDAARQIREQPWGRNIRLVALTGWGQEEDRQRTREAGFDGHLVKPAEPADLEALLANLFANR